MTGFFDVPWAYGAYGDQQWVTIPANKQPYLITPPQQHQAAMQSLPLHALVLC